MLGVLSDLSFIAVAMFLIIQRDVTHKNNT